MEELERSISETETQLHEIDQQKKLKEKKDKIEKLQKQLRGNERKIKKEKEGEIAKTLTETTSKASVKQFDIIRSDLNIKDLKSNEKLRKKLRKSY
ncbi:MAG: hypothetical protein AB2705_21175 [Candidatus Thiodiazotropha sp.]